MATCTNILKVMTYGEKSKVTGVVLNDDEIAVQTHNTFTMVNLLIALLDYSIRLDVTRPVKMDQVGTQNLSTYFKFVVS